MATDTANTDTRFNFETMTFHLSPVGGEFEVVALTGEGLTLTLDVMGDAEAAKQIISLFWQITTAAAAKFDGADGFWVRQVWQAAKGHRQFESFKTAFAS